MWANSYDIRSKGRRSEDGFTLVELLVILPILVTVVAVLLSVLVMVLSQINTARSSTGLIYETQNALDVIERDMSVSTLFLTSSDTGYQDTYGPDNAGAAWSYKGDSATSRTLITRNFATTESPYNGNRAPVFLNQLGCDTDHLYFNDPYYVNIIYFVRNNTLYRRTLTDPSRVLCATPYQTRSCPSDAAWVSACVVRDTALITGIQSFQVAYYLNPLDTAAADVYSSTNPDILDGMETIEVKLSASRTLSSVSKTIRISRLKE